MVFRDGLVYFPNWVSRVFSEAEGVSRWRWRNPWLSDPGFRLVPDGTGAGRADPGGLGLLVVDWRSEHGKQG